MTSHESVPVTFLNKDGQRLFGILQKPAVPLENGVTILLLSPGVKMRVAPHRMYNKMAKRFLDLGYPVFRFDFHGLGDSEGEAPEALLADLYGATQVGRYVADTVAAMDWMQRTYGTSRFIASGLCGGALTGLLTAERDHRITGLLGLSMPVVLDGSNIDTTQYMTSAQLEGTRGSYLRKLRFWDPAVWRSWARLLTFKSDFRLLFRSIADPLKAKLGPAAPPTDVTASPPDNTNPYFAPAFFRMVSTARPVCLIFAEADRLFWEFDAKFVQRYPSELESHSSKFDVHVIKQANHIFSFADWQQDMLNECCRWLRKVEVNAS